jgi:hypothetical protein
MSADLEPVFLALRALLARHAKGRELVHDTAAHYYLNEGQPDAKGKPVFAAAVKIGAGKVQFHLMPLYTQPELLNGVGDALRSRMQGKSCFNFNKVDEALFKELSALVSKALK